MDGNNHRSGNEELRVRTKEFRNTKIKRTMLQNTMYFTLDTSHLTLLYEEIYGLTRRVAKLRKQIADVMKEVIRTI